MLHMKHLAESTTVSKISSLPKLAMMNERTRRTVMYTLLNLCNVYAGAESKDKSKFDGFISDTQALLQ